MYKRIKNLFRIKGNGLLVICMLLIGIGVSITFPYLSLYLTVDVGMSAEFLGLFMAVSQLSGVVVNSFVAKRSDNGMDRKTIILIALVSSAIGYISFLVFDNYYILLFVFTFFSGLGWSEDTLRSETAATQKSKYGLTEHNDRFVVERVAELAEKHGVSRSQIALAWLLQKEPVTAPIIGATKISHIEDSVGALSGKLTSDEVGYLEEPYVPHRVVGALDSK